MTTERRAGLRALVPLLLTELGYLVYFHVVISAPHTIRLFGWLPFGDLKASQPATASIFYVVCLGTLFLLYVRQLSDLSHRPETRADSRIVFLGAALFSLTLIFVPTLLSKDLFDYMGHGRVLVVHGANPFTVPAADLPPDEFTRAMGWAAATPLYGPAWGSLTALLTLLGGGSFMGTVLIFKLFFAAVHLLNGYLVMRIARGWETLPGGLRPVRAAAFYLWNPLVLTQTIADAHNDGVALMWLLAGIWLLQRRDDLTGAAAAAMSVLVKYVTAPVVLLFAVTRLRESGPRRAVLFVAICAGVALLAYAPYLSGFNAAHFMRPYEHSSYQGGAMMLAEMMLGKLFPGPNVAGSLLAKSLLALSALAALALGVWYLRALWRVRGLRDATESGVRLLLLYLLFVTALLRTSYVVWIVGLAAVIASVTLRRAVAIFSCSVLALEVVWIYRLLLPSPAPSVSLFRFLATVVAVGVPILYLLLHFPRLPRKMKDPKLKEKSV